MSGATPLPRTQFPVTQHYRYLDHAGVSPLPVVCADAMAGVVTEYSDHGSARQHQLLYDRVELARADAARLLGVASTDVAFVKNTTEGLGFVASGIEWRAGDRVVVADHEFPSAVYPWLALADRGVQVDLVAPIGPARALPIDVFADALAAARTRLVCVSWVQFARGWRTDLAALGELCRQHGTLLCADVIQGLGVLPAAMASWGVDFAMADGHKWLLGPEGLGVLYVAERSRHELRPLEVGWSSVVHRTDWDNLELVLDPSARQFEGGTANLVATMGLGASMRLLLATTVEAVWAHVDSLCDHLVDGLRGAGATVLSDRSQHGRSGIVSFVLEGHDTPGLAESLHAEGFVVKCRGEGVRVAPHGYNTVEEIDAFVDAVARRH